MRPSKVKVAVWIIPRSTEVSVSLVRYLLSTALPNQTEAASTTVEMANTSKGELAKRGILKSSWVQNFFSHILNIAVTSKGHGDIQLIVNDL